MVLRKLMVVATMITATLCWQQDARAQCGSTNIAVNKTVLTSSNANGTTGAGVTDGLITSPSTSWLPNYSSSNWAQIDLDSSRTVCRVVVKWGRWNAASSFKIQMSNSSGTGATWNDIAVVTNNNPEVGNESGDYYTWFVYNDLNITSTSNTGRYIRILVETLSNPNWYVAEMEVYKTTTTNSPPTVALTNPTNTITIPANTPLQLKANATDPDGTITEVGFYNGTTLLNDPPQTSAPWEHTWTPVTPGTYSITAKAKDNNGAVATSLAVTVNVTTANVAWGILGNSLASTQTAFLGTTDTLPIIVKTNNVERYRVTKEGKILVGSTSLVGNAPANTLLTVNGYIMARGLKITQSGSAWPDYVFNHDYRLMPLPDLKSFIKKYKHLPGVPSAKEIAANGGVSVAETQEILLKKIEELTLYLLQQREEIEKLKKAVKNTTKKRNKVAKK